MAREKGKTSPDLSTARSEEILDSAHQRQQMIAEKAYFRALHRGFQGGDPVEDWIAAEREINEQWPGLYEAHADVG